MFFYKKLLMPRVFIVYVVKVKKRKYKIMYLLKNTYFNENYKGLVIIENEYNDVSFINEKLIISNKGKSNARNIKIYVDDKEIQKSETFGAYAQNMDFSLLTTNNSIGIKSIIHMGTKRNFRIKLIWDDDNSKNNITEDVINI